MPEGISAKDAGPAPLCDCHGEKKQWVKDGRKARGGYWTCAVKKRQRNRTNALVFYARNRHVLLTRLTERRAADRESYNESMRTWRAAHPDKVRLYNQRHYDADPIRRISRNLRAASERRAKTLARKQEQLKTLRAQTF